MVEPYHLGGSGFREQPFPPELAAASHASDRRSRQFEALLKDVRGSLGELSAAPGVAHFDPVRTRSEVMAELVELGLALRVARERAGFKPKHEPTLQWLELYRLAYDTPSGPLAHAHLIGVAHLNNQNSDKPFETVLPLFSGGRHGYQDPVLNLVVFRHDGEVDFHTLFSEDAFKVAAAEVEGHFVQRGAAPRWVVDALNRCMTRAVESGRLEKPQFKGPSLAQPASTIAPLVDHPGRFVLNGSTERLVVDLVRGAMGNLEFDFRGRVNGSR